MYLLEQEEDLSQVKYPKRAYNVNTDLHFNLLCEDDSGQNETIEPVAASSSCRQLTNETFTKCLKTS